MECGYNRERSSGLDSTNNQIMESWGLILAGNSLPWDNGSCTTCSCVLRLHQSTLVQSSLKQTVNAHQQGALKQLDHSSLVQTRYTPRIKCSCKQALSTGKLGIIGSGKTGIKPSQCFQVNCILNPELKFLFNYDYCHQEVMSTALPP